MNPLVRRLSHGAELTSDDAVILTQAFDKSVLIEGRQDLIREGQPPTHVHLITEGFACRYKMTPDGTRQIVALLLPGDFCDLHVTILNEMDHSIGTLTACKVARLDRKNVLDLITRTPGITRALWWATLVDEAILREWLVGIGRRSADKQVAHLFCELLLRLQTVDRASANSYDFPLSQADLSDILGLTPVHVNRMLQQLRADGLISLKERHLTIPDISKLVMFADFNPKYLHLDLNLEQLQRGTQPKR